MSTELQSLGKYELQERSRIGGIAEVWKAFDPELQRSVALEIFATDLQYDPDFITRFWNFPLIAEAQLLVSLHHPNIVHIHVFQIFHPPGSEQSLACMVMDYIKERTLADLVNLFATLAAALDYANQQGVIHGKITPSTILLDKLYTSNNPRGEPMFTDFGITELLGISVDAFSRLDAACQYSAPLSRPGSF